MAADLGVATGTDVEDEGMGGQVIGSIGDTLPALRGVLALLANLVNARGLHLNGLVGVPSPQVPDRSRIGHHQKEDERVGAAIGSRRPRRNDVMVPRLRVGNAISPFSGVTGLVPLGNTLILRMRPVRRWHRKSSCRFPIGCRFRGQLRTWRRWPPGPSPIVRWDGEREDRPVAHLTRKNLSLPLSGRSTSSNSPIMGSGSVSTLGLRDLIPSPGFRRRRGALDVLPLEGDAGAKDRGLSIHNYRPAPRMEHPAVSIGDGGAVLTMKAALVVAANEFGTVGNRQYILVPPHPAARANQILVNDESFQYRHRPARRGWLTYALHDAHNAP